MTPIKHQRLVGWLMKYGRLEGNVRRVALLLVVFFVAPLSSAWPIPDLPEIENISPELSLQEDAIEQEAPKQ